VFKAVGVAPESRFGRLLTRLACYMFFAKIRRMVAAPG
jgi:hypothetical protein